MKLRELKGGKLGLLLLMILFATLGARDVRAQIDSATLTGLVADANGAVVPGARVVAVNQATNIAAETVSGEDG